METYGICLFFYHPLDFLPDYDKTHKTRAIEQMEIIFIKFTYLIVDILEITTKTLFTETQTEYSIPIRISVAHLNTNKL